MQKSMKLSTQRLVSYAFCMNQKLCTRSTKQRPQPDSKDTHTSTRSTLTPQGSVASSRDVYMGWSPNSSEVCGLYNTGFNTRNLTNKQINN